MTYPNYNPITPDSDFTAIYGTVQDMYSDLLASSGCCPTVQAKQLLSDVDSIYVAIGIDSANSNTARYKEDVKAAYLLLYNYVSQ